MIYLSLMGGLGNQLFQYAYARKLAIRTKQEIRFDIYSLKKDNNRNYELGNFDIIGKIDSSVKARKYNQQYNICSKIYNKFFANKAFNYYIKKNVVIYLNDKYNDFELNKNKDIYLFGYFQSDKYFKEIDEILKKELYINPNTKHNILLNEIESNLNSVCIHYRKGDYKLKKNEQYQVCNTEYYINAIEYMKKTLDNPKFYVFSDNIEEVKEEFKKYDEIIYIDNVNNMIDEFALMMHCNNYIISNSSFSWWAQYLCSNKEKKVVAPKRWNKYIEIKDIYQENWICM